MMKVIDCFWEQKNIGRKTVEVIIDENDPFEREIIGKLAVDYEYIVIKIPMNMPIFNIGLAKMGFCCIETQMNIGISFDDFNFSAVNHLYDETSYEVVETREDCQDVLSHIEPGMFSTDRISIDPEFGAQIGCQRYINWITTEFQEKRSQLVKVLYQREHVGFMLIRQNKNNVILLLNGLYKPFQGKGLGLLTPASPLMYIKKNNGHVDSETTSISSNNIPVVKLYNKLHFRTESQTYVFVKHIKA